MKLAQLGRWARFKEPFGDDHLEPFGLAGDGENPAVEQFVVHDAKRQPVADVVRAVMAVPPDVRGLERGPCPLREFDREVADGTAVTIGLENAVAKLRGAVPANLLGLDQAMDADGCGFQGIAVRHENIGPEGCFENRNGQCRREMILDQLKACIQRRRGIASKMVEKFLRQATANVELSELLGGNVTGAVDRDTGCTGNVPEPVILQSPEGKLGPDVPRPPESFPEGRQFFVNMPEVRQPGLSLQALTDRPEKKERLVRSPLALAFPGLDLEAVVRHLVGHQYLWLHIAARIRDSVARGSASRKGKPVFWAGQAVMWKWFRLHGTLCVGVSTLRGECRVRKDDEGWK